MAARTIYRVLEATAAEHGGRAALYQPRTGDGQREYEAYTWSEYKRAVEEIAAGLRDLGVRKGDFVALDSETRLEFYLADVGIMTAGGIAAALYPSYPARDLVRTLQTVNPKAVFVEDPKTLAALRDAGVEHWILLTGEAEGALTLAGLRARGRQAVDADPGLVGRITAEVDPQDYAILYLTSGATGEPKMALVTHASITSNLDMGPQVLPIGPEDATVVFLPSAHIAQRVVMELLPIRCAMPVTFAESLMKLPQDIRTVRPTIFLAPPRMWERVYSTICTELRKKPAAVQKVFWGALGLGLAAAEYKRQGKAVPLRIRAPLAIADRTLFAKLRGRFGGRMKVAASGAVPLSKQLAEFYEAIGMPLIEGYGLTEGGVVSLNPIGRPKPGSIGKPLPGIEVRIAADGELQVKSPCLFRGYYNDPETTAEVLQDGWLRTGDIAFVDSDGYIFITGRKKELIVSSTGKKVYPARIENLFKIEPLISQVLLIGDRLPFVTALITLNSAATDALKGEDAAVTEVQKIVKKINRQLAPFEQVRKYRILARDFSIDRGELTATMKVRRTRVLENFSEEIAALYAGHEE